MISRERFEELKKETQIVFYILNNSVSILRLDETYGISTEEYNKTHNCKPQLFHNYNGIFQNICDVEKLFETKEEAEFALKFKRIPKVEYLDLPTFEEITTNDKYNYYGTSYFEFGDGYRLIVKLPSEDDDCEFIGVDVNGNCELYNWEEATKENYIEACRIAKKLFLGEEV